MTNRARTWTVTQARHPVALGAIPPDDRRTLLMLIDAVEDGGRIAHHAGFTVAPDLQPDAASVAAGRDRGTLGRRSLAGYQAERVTVPITHEPWGAQRTEAAYGYLADAFSLERLSDPEQQLIEWPSTWEADTVELLEQLVARARREAAGA